MADLYRIAGPIYDFCTAVWSGGAIWRSRSVPLGDLDGGARVLFPGGGTGRGAVEAARLGLQVTLVDRSPTMLRRARARAEKADVRIECIEADVWAWEPCSPFDAICANHFFNVFEAGDMLRMRERLYGWLAPGGSMVIADFRPIGGPAILRGLQRWHHWVPLAGCRALTRNAMHPIYDHGKWEGPWDSVQMRDHRVWRIGPGWYRTWVLQKPGGASLVEAAKAPAICR